ncbi:MAG: hypothetical protein AAF773_26070, partial [Cyanobacteria bacterium P01_D01_bin.115]
DQRLYRRRRHHRSRRIRRTIQQLGIHRFVPPERLVDTRAAALQGALELLDSPSDSSAPVVTSPAV